eukprot:551224_1
MVQNRNDSDDILSSNVEFEQKELNLHDMWGNKPEEVSQCTIVQIEFIINHVIADLSILLPHLQQILQYIQQNELDGNKLTNMSRKDFMKQAAAHFGNKKLTIHFGKLYSCIVKCDIKTFIIENRNDSGDIWSSNPQSISECNVNQIVYILNNDVIDKLDIPKLKSQKSNIIKFIEKK